LIVLGDAPEAWERLGFVVDDGVVALEGEQLRLTGEGGGILEVRAPGIEPADGLPLRAGDAVTAPAAAHPNGASVVDHVVVFTGSLDRTVGALQAAGLELRRRSDPMAFLRLGPYILEVVERGGDPARFWGLVVVVPDPGAVPGAGPAKDAVQPGRRIATMHGLGTQLAFMSPRRT
jgi:hypothetical protein